MTRKSLNPSAVDFVHCFDEICRVVLDRMFRVLNGKIKNEIEVTIGKVCSFDAALWRGTRAQLLP